MEQESPEKVDNHSAEIVAHILAGPGERGWFADMERALEHDTPERVLKTVEEIYAQHGDKLKDDERSFLERARKWALSSIELRAERNKTFISKPNK